MNLSDRWRTALSRVRRIERRELREFTRWLENTRNLVQLTVLLAMPVIIGLITAAANQERALPFVLFPPLASGTYTLFAEPEGRYSHPVKFVSGMTVGAASGVAALWLSIQLGLNAGAGEDALFSVSPVAAAVAVFLTGALTWALDAELPSAFSTALLALLVPLDGGVMEPLTLFVASVLVSSAVVALTFGVWHDRFYERRARYLYRSTKGDDHVLVPVRGDHPEASAMLAARLAGAHDAGKVVLLDVVDREAVAAAERDLLTDHGSAEDANGAVDAGEDQATRQDTTRNAENPQKERSPVGRERPPAGTDVRERDHGTRPDPEQVEAALDDVAAPIGDAEQHATAAAAEALETQANRIETKVGVPCEVMVAAGEDRASTVVDAALRSNCDLIVAPYEHRHGALTGFVRDLFEGPVDVLVHRSVDNRTRWKRVLVPVRTASDVAHAMLDFADRLVGSTGRIAACHCIDSPAGRRQAESMLADLAETVSGDVETRVSLQAIEDFLSQNAAHYDVVFLGASRDRSAASRFVSPPTFERIRDLDCDVAILDRNFRY